MLPVTHSTTPVNRCRTNHSPKRAVHRTSESEKVGFARDFLRELVVGGILAQAIFALEEQGLTDSAQWMSDFERLVPDIIRLVGTRA